MGKTFILLMLGVVIWLGEFGLSSQKSITGNIEWIFYSILKITFNHNLISKGLAGEGMFQNRISKINLVKTGNDCMLQRQNQPVDANT